MNIGIVLAGLAPRAVEDELVQAAVALAEHHDVHVWAPPQGYGPMRRRLPEAVTVRHADAAEARVARRRWRLRRPRVVRHGGLPDARLRTLLRDIDMDVVIVPTQAHARIAVAELPARTRVLAWSRDMWGVLERAGGAHAGSAERRVLAYGPLVGSARFGDAIRAFDAATTEGDGWRVDVRGTGAHAPRLQDLIDWRGLGGRAFVGETRDSTDELASARVMLATSSHASPGLQALDAAARGVPVIGYDDDPVTLMVADAGAGYVVPGGSVEALGAVLRWLLADNAAQAHCAERGRELGRRYTAASADERWPMLMADIERAAAGAEVVGEGSTRGASDADAVRQMADLTEAVTEALGKAGVGYGRLAADEGGEVLVTAAESVQAIAGAVLGADLVTGLELYIGRAAASARRYSQARDLPAYLAVVDRLRVLGSDPADVWLDVELWTADDQGLRRAPRPNRETDSVGPRSWSAWMASHSRTVTGLPLWDQVTFPIDAVFTWVDGADPGWQAKRDKFRLDEVAAESVDGVGGVGEERFLSRDEIYYAVAAARMRMPWLRRMIVVTDGQRHERISEEFPEVEFVDHREIAPDPTVLPVFNSHAIEASLHRVPGLAEHFVYFNDDMIVARPLQPTDFFAANGVARFFASTLTIGFYDDEPAEPHLLAAAHNRRLLSRDFGVEITRSMLHMPYAHRRSVLEEMDSRYSAEFAATRASRFRAGTDVSVMSSFAQHYGWLTARYVPGELAYRFVRLHGRSLAKRLDEVVADADVQVVALGEPLPGQQRHPEELALVQGFLESLLCDRP